MNNVKKPQWSDPNLEPGHFLYQRTGPWPQPSPSYPMEHAPEVLNIPAVEQLIWNDTIGARLLVTQVGFPPEAAANAAKDALQEIPSDDEFVRIMTGSMYARYLRNTAGDTWTASFSAMKLIADATLPGTYCAPAICHFKRAGAQFSCEKIEFPRISLPPLDVKPGDAAWNLAKAYALQGAAYHALFVVHPALHFPMDSVNAITKSAVPHIHPLFQLLYPHTSYTLALDNAVLEGPNSVVNNNVTGTWYDPLTAKGIDILRLFGPGYIGVEKNPVAYPAYDYLNPWMDERLPYGKCLKLYFDAFLTFATFVADEILANSPDDPYVKRWAKYLHANIPSFPDEKKIFEPGVLARTMAVYMWDVSVSHGADHYSFITDVAPGGDNNQLACWRFLRIRVAPPTKNSAPQVSTVGELCDPEDLYRTEMAQNMFFGAWTIKPNLNETYYAFASPELLIAQVAFHEELVNVSQQVKKIMPSFMPLDAQDGAQYSITLPASIQY
jgi:hypothetical protein